VPPKVFVLRTWARCEGRMARQARGRLVRQMTGWFQIHEFKQSSWGVWHSNRCRHLMRLRPRFGQPPFVRLPKEVVL